MSGTVRTFNEDVRKLISTELPRIAEGVAEACGCKAEVTYEKQTPAVINHPLTTKVLSDYVRKHFGDDAADENFPISMGGDDFAEYQFKVPGSIIRVQRSADGKHWTLAQVPQVEAAFVASNFNTGAVTALVGGFDFNLNMFNHVTQAWRQPSRRPGVNRGPRSSPSSIRRRSTRASRRAPSSTTRRFRSIRSSRATSSGSPRTTTGASTAR